MALSMSLTLNSLSVETGKGVRRDVHSLFNSDTLQLLQAYCVIMPNSGPPSYSSVIECIAQALFLCCANAEIKRKLLAAALAQHKNNASAMHSITLEYDGGPLLHIFSWLRLKF